MTAAPVVTSARGDAKWTIAPPVPSMSPEQAAALRAPFPKSAIGKLPRAGVQLDYVGHAAVTDRLLAVDPAWSWEPLAYDANGLPAVVREGKDVYLWVRLTVCGVTKLEVGSAPASSFDVFKQLVSDAIRRGAMRFGVALDLWAKEDLHAKTAPEPERSPGVPVTEAEVRAAGYEPPVLGPFAADEPRDASWVDGLRPRELFTECERAGLDTQGTLPELRDRLRAATAAVPPVAEPEPEPEKKRRNPVEREAAKRKFSDWQCRALAYSVGEDDGDLAKLNAGEQAKALDVLVRLKEGSLAFWDMDDGSTVIAPPSTGVAVAGASGAAVPSTDDANTNVVTSGAVDVETGERL